MHGKGGRAVPASFMKRVDFIKTETAIFDLMQV